LTPYRQKFVSAYTNRQRNFGQHTTNRVESQHSLLKDYLDGAHNSLDRLVGFVDHVVESQWIKLKHSFETSLIKTMGHHRLPVFDYLRGKVSHAALDLLCAEYNKLKYFKQTHHTCGCQLFTSCGLPCACRLEQYKIGTLLLLLFIYYYYYLFVIIYLL
jgi:hypothetical protein